MELCTENQRPTQRDIKRRKDENNKRKEQGEKRSVICYQRTAHGEMSALSMALMVAVEEERILG